MRNALLAALLFVGAAAVYTYRLQGAFRNGDEVIYAEMAREMAQGSGWLTLRWSGEPIVNRPPVAVWPLAIAAKLGAYEAGFRFVVGLEMAAAVALLFLYATRRYGVAVGCVAALVFASADRVWFYSRYIESEPLLLALTLGALVCWDRRWTLAWGALLGLAFLTKPWVGLLPLLGPLGDLVERREAPRPWRGLVVAAALVIPWHAYEWARHGRAFLDAYLMRNALARSMRALHQDTTPAFYFATLWQKEGPLVLLAVLGLVVGALRRHLVPVVWAVGVLGVFSLAASRYDYYMLPAYPALALGVAFAAVLAVPKLRGWLAVPVAAAWVALHLGPRFGQPTQGDVEIRFLAQQAREVSRPEDVLLVFNRLAYTARYYGERHTVSVLLDKGAVDQAAFLLPGEFAPGDDLRALTARYPRWFGIAPRVDGKRLAALGTVYVVGGTPTYLLFTNLSAR